MGETISVSFREDEEDLYEWLEDQHGDKGIYRNRSDVIIAALKEKRKRESGSDQLV